MGTDVKKSGTEELTMIEELRTPMAIGQVFADSGMFPDIKTQSQAVVKILAGKELGLTPFEAMNNIYIVNDKLSLMSNTVASLVKRHPLYDYQVKTLTDEECTTIFYEKTDKGKTMLGESTFTIKNAAKAGIVNKDVWKNYPRNMLFARSIANGVRWYCHDVLYGYCVEEEMRDIIDVTPAKHTTVTMSEDGGVSSYEQGMEDESATA